ncbi:MAG: tRNA (adenosine(37)-N6)-threonylcarbamoyltransferase complex dimerization subunit type 1 TsaB [Bdellovibrionota bacterium]
MILALETSTQWGSAALIDQGKVLAEVSSDRQKSHSELINPMIEACLTRAAVQFSDLTLVATGFGPGSFTGIRVAGNVAKSLSYTLNIPLFALDSLFLLAAQSKVKAQADKLPVLSMINAYKNMVYYGLYDLSSDIPSVLIPASVVPVRDLDQTIKQDQFLVVGDGYQTYKNFFSELFLKKLRRNENAQDYPLASTLGLLSEMLSQTQPTLDWKSFLPLYIRASEAEENRKGILFTPLK